MNEKPQPSAPPEQEPQAQNPGTGNLFPELEELQRDIERRLKDNRRFLEHFLDEDFMDELSADEDEQENPDDFEEL